MFLELLKPIISFLCFCILVVSLLLLIAGGLLAHLMAGYSFLNDCSVILRGNGEIEEVTETVKKELQLYGI